MERVRAFLERKLGRLTVVAAFIGLASWVLSRVAEQWFDRVVIGSFSTSWGWLTTQTVGHAGAALALALLGLILVAFLETSPTVQRLLRWQRTRRRSLEEVVAIERLREVWGHEAREACEHARQRLGDAMRHLLDRKQLLAHLLTRPLEDLRGAVQEFEATLAADAVDPLPDVQRRLRAVIDRYGSCVVWYNRCRRVDPTFLPPDVGDEHLAAHRRWAQYHRAFIEELARAVRRQSLRGLDAGTCASQLSLVRSLEDPPLAPELVALDEWPRA